MNTDHLDFVTFMIGCVAQRLKKPCDVVYRMLKEKNIINDYIVDCYDILHTFSRDYATDEVVGYMKYRGISV